MKTKEIKFRKKYRKNNCSNNSNNIIGNDDE